MTGHYPDLGSLSDRWLLKQKGHLRQEVTWPMLPLKNDLESCWWQKLTERIKNYLTTGIWEETYLREIFYGTLIFQQSSMACIGRHVGGHTLVLQRGGQNYFFLHLVKRFIATLRRCCKRDHIIFSTISLKFKCKMSAQKEVIHSFINHILVTWPATNVLILRKWCGFEKLNHHYFV